MTGHEFPGASMRNVLVVSPHPDDDVIGCGGTLHRLAESGASITVLYVTDGSASHPGSRRFPPSVLAAIREREAREALRELGVLDEPIFLRLPDGRLRSLADTERDRVVQAVMDVTRERKIDTIFTPWRRDPHADHMETASLIERSARSLRSQPRLLAYTVWASSRGKADVSPTTEEAATIVMSLAPESVSAKRRAVLRHQSQTTSLIDDDPSGFRIDPALLDLWTSNTELFFELRTAKQAST